MKKLLISLLVWASVSFAQTCSPTVPTIALGPSYDGAHTWWGLGNTASNTGSDHIGSVSLDLPAVNGSSADSSLVSIIYGDSHSQPQTCFLQATDYNAADAGFFISSNSSTGFTVSFIKRPSASQDQDHQYVTFSYQCK